MIVEWRLRLEMLWPTGREKQGNETGTRWRKALQVRAASATEAGQKRYGGAIHMHQCTLGAVSHVSRDGTFKEPQQKAPRVHWCI